MHWASNLIGLPYAVAGCDPGEGFNCWSFVRYVQYRFYGRTLPEIPNSEHYADIVRTFRDHPERERWDITGQPHDGDLVLLSRRNHPCHIGIFLNVDGGGILHCASQVGVEFAKLSAVAFGGWHINGFFRFNGGVT